MSELSFTCADGAGEQHSYTLTLHRGQEGFPIAMRLWSLVVGPIAGAFGPVILQALGDGEIQKPADLLDNLDLVRTLDFDKIAETVRTTLVSCPPALIYQVLVNTNRDGKPLIGGDGRPTLAFDEAFAGNYLELPVAVWEVCRLNSFFPELSTLAAKARKARGVAPALQKSTA